MDWGTIAERLENLSRESEDLRQLFAKKVVASIYCTRCAKDFEIPIYLSADQQKRCEECNTVLYETSESKADSSEYAETSNLSYTPSPRNSMTSGHSSHSRRPRSYPRANSLVDKATRQAHEVRFMDPGSSNFSSEHITFPNMSTDSFGSRQSQYAENTSSFSLPYSGSPPPSIHRPSSLSGSNPSVASLLSEQTPFRSSPLHESFEPTTETIEENSPSTATKSAEERSEVNEPGAAETVQSVPDNASEAIRSIVQDDSESPQLDRPVNEQVSNPSARQLLISTANSSRTLLPEPTQANGGPSSTADAPGEERSARNTNNSLVVGGPEERDDTGKATSDSPGGRNSEFNETKAKRINYFKAICKKISPRNLTKSFKGMRKIVRKCHCMSDDTATDPPLMSEPAIPSPTPVAVVVAAQTTSQQIPRIPDDDDAAPSQPTVARSPTHSVAVASTSSSLNISGSVDQPNPTSESFQQLHQILHNSRTIPIAPGGSRVFVLDVEADLLGQFQAPQRSETSI